MLPYPALLLLLFIAGSSTGCAGWPLYWVQAEEFGEVQEESSSYRQELEGFTVPATVRILGRIDACGWDADGVGPSGVDGLTDIGWFAGDIDRFSFTPHDDALLFARLEWELQPESGQNAPYDPANETGAWTTESDLDLFVVDSSIDDPGAFVDASGLAGQSAPAILGDGVPLTAGTRIDLQVACHHSLGSRYLIDLYLLRP